MNEGPRHSPSFLDSLRRRPQPHSGFTLLELLVAIAVLGLILSLMAAILQQSQKQALDSTRRTQAQATGRAVLDRIEQDIQSMAATGGATLIVGQSPDQLNDALAFLCFSASINNDATYANMRMAAVYYAIQTNPPAVTGSGDSPALIRGLGPLNWDSTNGDPMTVLAAIAGDASSSTSNTTIATDHTPVGRGVIRFAVTLQLQNGSLMPNDPTQSNFPKSTAFTRALPSSPTFVAVNLSQVKAITISLALLDSQTRAQVSSSLNSIAQKFVTPTYSNSLTSPTPSPCTLWLAALTPTTFSTYPPSVCQYTQLIERTIVLH